MFHFYLRSTAIWARLPRPSPAQNRKPPTPLPWPLPDAMRTGPPRWRTSHRRRTGFRTPLLSAATASGTTFRSTTDRPGLRFPWNGRLGGRSFGEESGRHGPDTKGVHGIAIANDLNRGYTSNGQDSSVTVFDLRSLAVITKIGISGKNPDAILYDPFSRDVFTFNGKSSNASVIETKGNRQIATIPLDGKPEFAATDGQGMAMSTSKTRTK